ncbi:MAG: TIGR00270 family protein [bacterium]|nr:TIGR00270 family protein [bacterium]
MPYTCELCGKVTDKVYRVVIDGAEFLVCEDCKKYGKLVGAPAPRRPRPQLPRPREPKLEELEVLPDVGEIVRQERQRRGLRLEELAAKLGISASYLRRIEQGKTIPDERTLKKLENFFEISLRAPMQELEIKLSSEDINYTVTLGDIAQIEYETKEKEKNPQVRK